ncbi:MAG TPA: MFS transporter [Steroidobacteraceae bacterium]|nr:MFS transporter [Steroidobacteraceae bacterium]
MFANQTVEQQSKNRYAWFVVFILMVCYTLSFVDRQILAFLVGPIKRDLGVTDTQIGLLQGFAFALFYTFLGVPIGWLADRMNRRNIIAIGVVFWSIMTALGSAVRTYAALFGVRIGVGVGEATLAPAAMSLVADYFPKDKLSSALSVYSMGILIGSGIASIVGGIVAGAVATMPPVEVPVLGAVAAWQLTFLVVGLPGLLVAFLVFAIREPLRQGLLKAGNATVQLSIGEIVAQLRARWQSVVGVSLAMAFQAMANYVLILWGPEFFRREYDWARPKVGLVLGLITLTFGCIGLFVGGRLSDRWLKEGKVDAPLRVGMIGVIGVGCTLVPATLVGVPALTVAFLVPALFFLGLPIGSAYASLQMIFPNQVRGVVSAVMIFILNMGGLGLGPLLPGIFNDYLFKDEAMLGASMALTVGMASVLGAVLFYITRAPYRRHYNAMHGT